jgi:hypothetical protein
MNRTGDFAFDGGNISMARESKGKSSCWYAYLMAGDRSSPVLRDSHLDTGNPKTIYMYNLERGEIIEYACEIVEKKLRDLKPDESGYITKLDAGYKKARRSFKGRGNRKSSATVTAFRPRHKARNLVDDDDIKLAKSDMCMEFE